MCPLTVKEQVLALLVRSRLADDMRTYGQMIDVYVADSDIYLVGTVDEETQRKVAEELVRGLPGVRRVVDNIRIRDAHVASA